MGEFRKVASVTLCPNINGDLRWIHRSSILTNRRQEEAIDDAIVRMSKTKRAPFRHGTYFALAMPAGTALGSSNLLPMAGGSGCRCGVGSIPSVPRLLTKLVYPSSYLRRYARTITCHGGRLTATCARWWPLCRRSDSSSQACQGTQFRCFRYLSM